MRPFVVDPKMTTIQGVFYPTGYVFLMFANAGKAQEAADKMEIMDIDDENIMMLTPQDIMRAIGDVDGGPSSGLPSIGTEGATARRFVKYAREGHHALMIESRSDEDTELIMTVARNVPFSYGKKYHMLAIQDLE